MQNPEKSSLFWLEQESQRKKLINEALERRKNGRGYDRGERIKTLFNDIISGSPEISSIYPFDPVLDPKERERREFWDLFNQEIIEQTDKLRSRVLAKIGFLADKIKDMPDQFRKNIQGYSSEKGSLEGEIGAREPIFVSTEARLEEETLKLKEKIESKIKSIGFFPKAEWEFFKERLKGLRPKFAVKILPLAIFAIASISASLAPQLPLNERRSLESRENIVFQTYENESASKILFKDDAQSAKEGSDFDLKAGDEATLSGSVFQGGSYNLKVVLGNKEGFKFDEMALGGYSFKHPGLTFGIIHSGKIGGVDLPGEKLSLIDHTEGKELFIKVGKTETKMILLGQFTIPADIFEKNVELILREAEKNGFQLRDRKYFALITCSDWNSDLKSYEKRKVTLFVYPEDGLKYAKGSSPSPVFSVG